MSNGLKTRLAPTPSGLLHPGNGVSFVLTWVLARAAQGQLLLRIDDLDEGRRREEYVEDIFYTLDWLGLDYDEGPSGPEDFFSQWSQHKRLDLYHQALNRLVETGSCYACACSRSDIARLAGPGGLYPGVCREAGIGFDQPETAWRLRLPDKDTALPCVTWNGGRLLLDAAQMGDFVVKQKNGLPAYQLASIVDDLYFGINAIVRGIDLLPSTAAQLFLAKQLGFTRFGSIRFIHHGLLTEANGEKMSKSKGAGSLRAWREAGLPPLALYRQAGEWLGAPTEAADCLNALVGWLQSTSYALKSKYGSPSQDS
jgi:glutamyl-tRNA synthetase